MSEPIDYSLLITGVYPEKEYKLGSPVKDTLPPATAASAISSFITASSDYHNKMASGLQFIVVLCLTSGLWIGANVADDCCKACPFGWTLYDQKCYMFHHDEKDWADAERFCTTRGANLASIHNAGEYEFLRTTIQTVLGKHKPAWVGGYDAPKEGAWKWSDGSLFDFEGWAQGEPNNAGGEHCMEINFKEKNYVNDIKCDTKHSFFCVRNL